MLDDAVTNRRSPFRIPLFVCGDQSDFDGRIAVLRKSDQSNNLLQFHSDIRSDKIPKLKNNKNINEVKIERGKEWTGLSPVDWACEVERLGAGEILLNSIDRDGLQNGYDIELIQDVVNAVSIPVISIGGVGHWEDFKDALVKGGVSAVSAANIFHHTEQSVLNAKKYLFNQGIDVRTPELLKGAEQLFQGKLK